MRLFAWKIEVDAPDAWNEETLDAACDELDDLKDALRCVARQWLKDRMPECTYSDGSPFNLSNCAY